MPIIYLIRHGITAANKENRFAGRSDELLLPEGKAQIRQVAERLKNDNIAKIYCGPSKRTVESAAILANAWQASVSAMPEFDEIDIPHWEGLTKDEIRLRFGDQYPTWLGRPEIFSVEGCETLVQVQKRAVEGIRRISAIDRSENLLVVSHLIVLRCLFLFYQGLALNNFRSVKIDNAAIVSLALVENGSGTISCP